jgi:epoxyqueuosine reductase
MVGSLPQSIRDKAAELGFDCAAIAPARLDGAAKDNLHAFLAAKYHGDMDWLAETAARRGDPQTLWPEAKSVIMLGIGYGPEGDPLELLARPERGMVSVYARGVDYHEVIKRKLKVFARWLAGQQGGDVKLFVDTAPVMEKPLAEAAGLGWQGKHTNLVSRRHGSWLFLASIFTTLELPPDRPERDHCGTCSRCLDVCPTKAFPAPYQLDARRCISYLTIEHKGPIPRELRPALQNRIYGCDDCLAVCPWNKFATRTKEYAFLPRVFLTAPRLADLASLDEAAFRQIFAGSPIKRIGRARFLRNVLIAIGNSQVPELVASVEPHLADPSPLVRGSAVWALARLAPETRLRSLYENHFARESDPDVQEEWRVAVYQGAASAA